MVCTPSNKSRQRTGEIPEMNCAQNYKKVRYGIRRDGVGATQKYIPGLTRPYETLVPGISELVVFFQTIGWEKWYEDINTELVIEK